jgi:predicted nucleic acid-binding protein
MRYLLDVNALVALGFLQHEFHERVAHWIRALASKGVLELATCSMTELGFVRILAASSAIWIHRGSRTDPAAPSEGRKRIEVHVHLR